VNDGQFEEYDPQAWDAAVESDDDSEQAEAGEVEEKDPAELAAREPQYWLLPDPDDEADDQAVRDDDEQRSDAGSSSGSGDHSDPDSDSDSDEGYVTAEEIASDVEINAVTGTDSDVVTDSESDADSDDQADSSDDLEYHDARSVMDIDPQYQRWMAEWRVWAMDKTQLFPDLDGYEAWGWDEWAAWRTRNLDNLQTYYHATRWPQDDQP
jgi:hypothetical protein